MFCKTIILSNSENLTSNAPKGILTLSKENSCIKGKIRLYNINLLPPQTKIGLYVNEKVHISSISKKPNHYEFDLNENIDITQSIYCALIDNSSSDKKVLLEGGSFNGFYFSDSPFDAILEAKDEQLEQTIDSAIKQSDKCENCNCENCEYKNYFYQNYDARVSKANESEIKTVDNVDQMSNLDAYNKEQNSANPIEDFQQSVINTLKQEVVDDIKNIEQSLFSNNNVTQNNETHNKPEPEASHDENNLKMKEQLEFLNDIIYQLDEMLKKYPEDEMLNSIIPDSRFVRVDGHHPYVLGVIYENKQLRYIAYGVPAQYNSLPPTDLGKHYQWLPLNPRDTMSDGYFMIYQDAINGTIVEIEFEEQ